jgi:putative ABC transport system ATP-binding protein
MYLEIRDVKKSYGSDASYIQVLKGITTSLEKGQMCVIQGTSGSGKSTLLNCIGGLDTMDSGSVKVDGKEIFGLKPDKLADYRKENLGFIFQFYNLVPNLTVVENIQVCDNVGTFRTQKQVSVTAFRRSAAEMCYSKGTYKKSKATFVRRAYRRS